MGMLSHLTKSRPKAGRAASKKGSESAAIDKAEVTAEAKESSASADALAATTSADVLAQPGEEVQSEPTPIQPEVPEVEVAVQEPTPVAAAPESNSEPEAFVPPRPPVPVPRPRPAPAGAGESRSSVVESRQSIAEGRKSLVVDNTATPITPTTPSYHAGMVDMMTGAPAPPPRPRPAPRTESADRPLSTLSQTESPHESLEQLSASNNGTEEQHTTNAVTTEDGGDVPARPVIPPKPPVKKIPGVFSNQRGHNAMAALASAMNSRAASVGAGARSSVVGGEEHAVTPSTPTDAAGDQPHDAHVEANGESASSLPHHMSAEALQPARRLSDNSSADPHLQSPVLLAQPLNIKKVAHSVSGDDKAIEKHALDWLNLHLASKEIVVDDLYTSLGDGLKLIYALEDATGESVGKYNKRAALPVHKIDNCAVALNFLQKKGINTQFMTPQDMLDGKKDKILTLFNYITKKF
ncbi:hypothetical protein BDR26DRAFT_863472 [Obelidium mucronatum]|nr:hypothetical protein BDR26DRAFT_863472 [Obelidium mucronatum]